MRRPHPKLRGRKNLLILAGIALSALLAACSHKSPVAPAEPPQPGVVYFDWLSALLEDQDYAQPNHELMQWLDDPANYPRTDKVAELRTLLDRLGGSPDDYRKHAPGYSSGDEPILDAIQVYVEQARAYLNQQVNYEPLLQRSGG